MTKVCLVLPHNRLRISPQPYYLENLGIQYIASHLRMNGIDCSVIDADGSYLPEKETLSEINAECPTLVGFSLSIDTSESVFRMCNELRRTHPEIFICLGGQHATYFAHDILENEPSVDFIVLGEGEETLKAVCESIESSLMVPPLSQGLAYRVDDEIVVTQPMLLQRKLDSYPNPDRSFLLGLRHRGAYAMPLILTSRGCPNKCSFCSSHDFFGGLWRTREPNAVVSEMETICESLGFTHFYFVDDQILGRGTQDKGHLLAIVDEILKRDLHRRFDLYSFVMMRADFHKVLSSDELLRFRLAGFKDIFIGFESGSNKELALFAKGFKSDDYKDTLLLKQQFFLEGGFILFHPYTTLQTLVDDARLINALGIPSWSYYSKRLVPYPGTRLFNRMLSEGKLIECSYRKISYELLNRTVRDIYDSVTTIEAEIGDCDDEIFAIVDAYQKGRLRDFHAPSVCRGSYEAQTEKLRARLQDLADVHYQSFVAMLDDPHSLELRQGIVATIQEKAQLIRNDYNQALRNGLFLL